MTLRISPHLLLDTNAISGSRSPICDARQSHNDRQSRMNGSPATAVSSFRHRLADKLAFLFGQSQDLKDFKKKTLNLKPIIILSIVEKNNLKSELNNKYYLFADYWLTQFNTINQGEFLFKEIPTNYLGKSLKLAIPHID
mgnify:CR=1 FL=1